MDVPALISAPEYGRLCGDESNTLPSHVASATATSLSASILEVPSSGQLPKMKCKDNESKQVPFASLVLHWSYEANAANKHTNTRNRTALRVKEINQPSVSDTSS